MFAHILKYNPYHHAETGEFTTKESASSWKQVGAQGGSNPGGVFEDQRGTRHYVKFPQRNPEQAQTEHLADAIYRELGIPAKSSQLVTNAGKMGLAGKMLSPSEEIGESAVNRSSDVRRGYVADAYLANWDVFGMAYDNILGHGGQDYRIDNGGTMFFRAQGEQKAFPADRVDELDSMLEPGRQGKRAFHGLTHAQKTFQAHRLVTRLTDQKLGQLVAGSGLTGDRAQAYLTALKGRRDVIASRFGVRKMDITKFLAILRRKPKPRKMVGWQEVPMDIESVRASLAAAAAQKEK